MRSRRSYLPEGVQDFLPEECGYKRALEARLRQEFRLSGFLEVETPSFEYYDVFADGVGAYMQEHMIKFFDHRGRILALRPDITVPIARMTAASFEGAQQLRLCYIQNAFAQSEFNSGRRGEYTQAGVEYLGKAGSGADAELIALAVKSMLAAGLRDFTIDIGQVAFFKGLLAGAELCPEEVEELRVCIDMKNNIELEYLLARLDIPGALREKLLVLPDLFGGVETVNRARQMAPECAAALDNLQEIYDALCGFGYERYVSIDLGMLHDLDYYSGVVFRGLATGLGFPVLSGGRYDRLLREFGRDMPAVGFALGIKRTLIALEAQGALAGEQPEATVVACDAGAVREAYAYAEKLRGSGRIVIFELEPTQSAMEEYQARQDVTVIYAYTGGQMKRMK